VGEYVEDAVIIDLFSGSGGLGLEAISRGAKICYFCDNSAESIRLTKYNISLCGAEGRSRIIAGGYEKALSRINEKADLIILDPPYQSVDIEAVIEKLSECGVLRDGGVIAAEHGTAKVLAEAVSGFNKIKEKKYGKVRLSLFS